MNPIKQNKKIVEIPKIVSVKEFAYRLGLPVSTIITTLLKNGVVANINESIDYETAEIIADELGFSVTIAAPPTKEEEKATETKKGISRPPIVTVLGHVDHGKTSLLDYIRKTNIIATESGGITQHIGAYQVKVKPGKNKSLRKITFFDTPGHEAFVSMRGHGVRMTDIVILVIAADEGVKEQTIEAISHAKAAKVPIVVAINKIDKPQANIGEVERKLSEIGLVPEKWGGETITVEVSAKTGHGIDQLLEMILLVADLQGLQADPSLPGKGVVIESHIHKSVGPVASLLIQDGTLHQGDFLVVGQTYGKVRIMENDSGKKIKEAGPSCPVRISGLKSLPSFGDWFQVVSSLDSARKMVTDLIREKTIKGLVKSIKSLQPETREEIGVLNLILKADTQGSLEAIRLSLEELKNPQAELKIISQGIGSINESDINLAQATGASIYGFKVSPAPLITKLAKKSAVEIFTYEVIYSLIEDISQQLISLITPKIIEIPTGTFVVLEIFYKTREYQIIGGKVIKGEIALDHEFKISRRDKEIGSGKVISLQQEKKSINKVGGGFECGLKVESLAKIKEGDRLEFFKKEVQKV